MTEHLSSSEISAWRDFLRVHATVVNALEQELQTEQGLSLSWYDVLVQLSEAPQGQLRLQVLAESVLLSRSGLTRIIDRMEREGLVRREPCPEDRRGFYALITDAGWDTLRRAAPGHLDGVARHFIRPLDAGDIGSLQTALGKILQAEPSAKQTNAPVQADLET